MKRIAYLIAGIFCTVLLCAYGCSCGNKNMIDLTYTFNYAIISLPNGAIVEGKVQKWNDYEDGDQIQVKIDGVTYLVHSSNITLMANKNK